MIKLQPQGTKLIVHEMPMDNFVTEGNIEIANLELAMGEVLEVPNELAEIYAKGDKVLFSKGAGMTIPYDRKPCLFLDGRGQPNGDVIAKIIND